MRASADSARVFFALWPDEAARAALARLAANMRGECGGRTVPARNLHLTLAFIGNIHADRAARLLEIAANVAAPSFAMTLDAVGYWRHNRIVWAGPRECPIPLRRLVAALESALRDGNVRFDERPYAPHVTLLRDARAAPLAQATDGIAWRADDFALVRSVRGDGGPLYEVIGRWPLNAAVGG
jgi:2'-5' RNA ligase